MPWWPAWNGEWYEALLWLVAAIVFGWLFGLRFGMWYIERQDLNKYRKRWDPYYQEPWWRRIFRWFRGRNE